MEVGECIASDESGKEPGARGDAAGWQHVPLTDRALSRQQSPGLSLACGHEIWTSHTRPTTSIPYR